MQANLKWEVFESELRPMIVRSVRDRAVADDILQDVFVKAYRHLGDVRDETKVSAWIHRIARNAVMDHFRKARRALPAGALADDNSVPNYNDCVISFINAAIQTLPDKYRIPLELADLHKVPQHELAARLGLGYPAAKSRVQRARQLLRRKIDESLIVRTDGYGNVVVCESRLCRRT